MHASWGTIPALCIRKRSRLVCVEQEILASSWNPRADAPQLWIMRNARRGKGFCVKSQSRLVAPEMLKFSTETLLLVVLSVTQRDWETPNGGPSLPTPLGTAAPKRETGFVDSSASAGQAHRREASIGTLRASIGSYRCVNAVACGRFVGAISNETDVANVGLHFCPAHTPNAGFMKVSKLSFAWKMDSTGDCANI
jgi:hypothetical protein